MYTQENAMLLQKDKSRHGVVGGDALPADPNAKFWQPQPEISVQARPQLSLPPVETRVKPAVGTVKPEATAAATDELPLPPASQS